MNLKSLGRFLLLVVRSRHFHLSAQHSSKTKVYVKKVQTKEDVGKALKNLNEENLRLYGPLLNPKKKKKVSKEKKKESPESKLNSKSTKPKTVAKAKTELTLSKSSNIIVQNEDSDSDDANVSMKSFPHNDETQGKKVAKKEKFKKQLESELHKTEVDSPRKSKKSSKTGKDASITEKTKDISRSSSYAHTSLQELSTTVTNTYTNAVVSDSDAVDSDLQDRSDDSGKTFAYEESPVSGLNEMLTFPLFMNGNEDEFVPRTFDLPPLNRKPSVTKIINDTMSPESRFFLEKWEKEMIEKLGEDGFKKYKLAIFKRGHDLHACIEQFYDGHDMTDIAVSEEAAPFWSSVQPVLFEVTEVKSLEERVTHSSLGYTGILDCLAYYKGKPCVIDWKTSSKPKPKLRDTYDNPLQVAAYAGAINQDSSFNFEVRNAMVVVTYEDGSPANAHFMTENQLERYWYQWLRRLHQFWKTKKQQEIG